MKKALLILSLAALVGCTCIGQIPQQYAYVDSACQATLPDYQDLVVVDDNCGLVTVLQIPAPGTIIETSTTVEMRGTDQSGNTVSMYFGITLLDTIAPTMQLNPEWVGYTDKEVGDMFRTTYGWIQLNLTTFNQTLPLAEWPGILPSSCFYMMIEVPDSTRNEWWWGVGYPEI